MTELILDGGERLDGTARLLKLNETPDGSCVTVSIPDQRGIVAVLDREQQRRLVSYLAKQLWPLDDKPRVGWMGDISGTPYGPSDR